MLECSELRFGHQAGFRRHYRNLHAEEVIEHFCPVSGCAHSRCPSNQGEGRGFRARKDKMEEHLQAVHCNLKRSPVKTGTEEHEDSDEDTLLTEGPNDERPTTFLAGESSSSFKRRLPSSPSHAEPEIIAGHVLTSGMFKCVDPIAQTVVLVVELNSGTITPLSTCRRRSNNYAL